MTKYILHGGFTRTDNELNRSFYEEIVRDIPDGGTVLLCYFASKGNDILRKFTEDSQSLKKQSYSKNLNFVLANEKDFIEQVKQADALYIRGGSTPRLLEILRRYPDLKQNLKGKTIAGSSAGAYVIGRRSPFHDDESGGEVREGLSLLPFRVVCHYESPDQPPTPRALESLQKMNQDLELILLKDFEWKIFID